MVLPRAPSLDQQQRVPLPAAVEIACSAALLVGTRWLCVFIRELQGMPFGESQNSHAALCGFLVRPGRTNSGAVLPLVVKGPVPCSWPRGEHSPWLTLFDRGGTTLCTDGQL